MSIFENYYKELIDDESKRDIKNIKNIILSKNFKDNIRKICFKYIDSSDDKKCSSFEKIFRNKLNNNLQHMVQELLEINLKVYDNLSVKDKYIFIKSNVEADSYGYFLSSELDNINECFEDGIEYCLNELKVATDKDVFKDLINEILYKHFLSCFKDAVKEYKRIDEEAR